MDWNPLTNPKLTRKHSKYDDPLLFEHQKRVVQAMITLECKPWIKNKNNILKTSAGILSDMYGTGKTISLLKLLESKHKLYHHEYHSRCLSQGYNFVRDYEYFCIKPINLIVVGSSVLRQWESEIYRFSNLGGSLFVISNYHSLKKYLASYEKYSIVLVKMGQVSNTKNNLGLSEKLSEMSKVNILDVLTDLSLKNNFKYLRVVMDDFDTLKIRTYYGIIPANFTWYISATQIYQKYYHENMKYLSQFCNVFCDYNLKNYFNICCDNNFIKSSIDLYKVYFYKYKIKNKYRKLLNGLVDEIDDSILMMLNGDAVSTAASELGIQANSIFDICTGIIGKSTQRLKELKLINSPTTNEMSEIDKLEAVLQRIQRNISSEECPICCLELEDTIVIMKCCGEVICGLCLYGGCRIRKRLNGSIEASCPHCKSSIDIRSDLLVVNYGDVCEVDLCKLENFDNSDNSKNNFEEELEKVELAKVELEKSLDEYTKKEMLQYILNNNISEVNSFKVSDINVNVMQGELTQDPITRKFMIFCDYNETLDNIEGILGDHVCLKGTINQKARALEEFQSQTNIMLINSNIDYSGFNAQCVTDIIFMHRIKDDSILEQLIGRGQRIGRVSDLNLHFIEYSS